MDLTSRLLTTVGPLLGKNSGYRWLIKRHPGMPRAKAEAAVSTYSRDAELVEGDFFEYLAQASVVIGLGSNTLIEAVAAGVPTICASSGNEPTEVPFSSSFKLGWWSVCYDSAELAALIPLAIEASETHAPSQDLKEALLGPFDVSVMHALLFSPLQPIDSVGGGARYSPS